MPASPLAARLLDAQVAWTVGQMTGPGLPDLTADVVDELLDAGTRIRLEELVGVEQVGEVTRLLAQRVPPSTLTATLVEVLADRAHAGPEESFTLAEVVDRDHVAALVDAGLARTDLVHALLDDLSHNPLVAGLAARFVVQVATGVLQANRAAAEKIPGVGGLVSFGAGAAGKVFGAADKQIESVLGDTAGKGAGFAMRRLNVVVVETLRHPTTREAVLQAYDRYADRPVRGAHEVAEREEVLAVAGTVQDVVIDAAVSAPVLALVDAVVAGLWETYGELPVATLVEDLDLTRDDLVARAQSLVPRVLSAAEQSGDLERIVRARLAPFYDSPELAAVLAEA
ncbi:hypothetical protein [Nocardioides nanhaiensis]|uniref:hypothetical protein n=1 Tax=Nocardioides nanhaiensis TaxID=1476871 RepID=UPI0031EC8876